MLRGLFWGATNLVVISLFLGCSSKNESSMKRTFDKNIAKHTKLQKSEKIKISLNEEVKVAITATYLNSKESLHDEKNSIHEKFIVGIYQSGDIYGVGFSSNEQNITLNIDYPKTDKELTKEEERIRRRGYNALPLISRELSHSDPILSNIPLVNSWTQYYLLEFPHTNRDKFVLIYQNRQLGRTKHQLSFAKSAKYLYFTEKEKEKYILIK